MDSTSAWQFYADNIIKLTVGEINADLQWFCVAGITTPCSLINAQNELVSDNVFQLGNSIPALSNSYIPFSDLSTSYQLFLSMLTPSLLGMSGAKSKNVPNEISHLQQEIAKRISSFTQNTLSLSGKPTDILNQRMKAFKSIQSQEVTLEKAFKANNQQRYANIITDARNKLWSANIMTQATGFNMASMLTSGVYYPRYEMPSFVEQFSRWRIDAVNPVLIEINHESINKHQCISGSPCQATAIHRGLSPDVDLLEPMVSKSVQIEVGFQRLGSFDINPGRWFNLSLIRLQRKASPNDMQMFFGQNGTMGLMPSKIILGFRPWVRYVLKDSVYRNYKKTFQDKINKISQVSKHNTSSGNDYHFQDSTSTISYGPTSTNLPTLVGVLSTRLDHLSA